MYRGMHHILSMHTRLYSAVDVPHGDTISPLPSGSVPAAATTNASPYPMVNTPLYSRTRTQAQPAGLDADGGSTAETEAVVGPRSNGGGGGGGGGAEGRAAHKGSGDDGAIRCQCRCRSGLDDGFSIACDVCGRWCHGERARGVGVLAVCAREASAGVATTTTKVFKLRPAIPAIYHMTTRQR
ncbi:hypothetical protein B0H10DRAFT_1234741 [Mycena sp. CBHHK59/15]|nr:hypothetical protein B0H10DRAFT_1234741 [Mycena sp. CBHHK59/15]